MLSQPDDAPATLECGDRVRVHNDTLQAFYGTYGTVVKICRCPRDGHITGVDVEMDDLPALEGQARFYPHDLRLLAADE